ncbi:MAG: AAA family ATPase [Thermoplasmatota archaeon]
MRIRRLLLHNYRRYRDAEVEFPDGVFALLGRNGFGKSTLLEAISFALFGPAAIRTDKALLRSDAAGPGDAVRVEIDLELGGQAVRIQRELRGKGQMPSASLFPSSSGRGAHSAATSGKSQR